MFVQMVPLDHGGIQQAMEMERVPIHTTNRWTKNLWIHVDYDTLWFNGGLMGFNGI